jgi:hypothetical protein
MIIAAAILAHSFAPPPRVLRDGVKGKWSASFELVEIKGGSSLTRFAQKDYWAAETARFNRFVKDTKSDFRENKGDFGLSPWTYEGGGSVVFNKKNVVSISAGCYTYMGGAHGLGVTRTYNYGLVGGKPKRLSLWDIVRKEGRQEVRLLLLGKAAANPNTDWIQDGMFNDFDEEQLNRFWISADGLTFEFDPYELGSYASGAFSFKVTFKELKPVLREKNPLSGLLR